MLSDDTDGEAVMLRPNGLQCAGVWVSAGLPSVYIQGDPSCTGCVLYTYRVILHAQAPKYRLAQNSNGAGRSGTNMCLYKLPGSPVHSPFSESRNTN